VRKLSTILEESFLSIRVKRWEYNKNMAKDEWRIKGGRRKGKKALKYADLL
jgi:hypothetical protein